MQYASNGYLYSEIYMIVMARGSNSKNEYSSIVNTAIVLLGNGVILVSLINYSIIVFIKVWD